jgi:hypothetical protein
MLFRKKKPLWMLAKIVDEKGNLMGTHQCWARPPVPTKEFPWLFYVTFTFEGGMVLPSEDEFGDFELISQEMEELEQEGQLCHVGIVTIEGKRDFICYRRDKEPCLQVLFERFASKGALIEAQHDPKWSQFKDLLAMMR